MLSVQKAKELSLEHQIKGQPKTVSISDACGLFVAEDIVSHIDLPIFDSSAMDGFALRAEDTADASNDNPCRLNILEEIWAGKVPEKEIGEMTTARIMTGAVVPKGADTVVMQEDVRVEGDKLVVTKPVKEAKHIRYCGEEITKGDVILGKGLRLTPPAIGLLASAGINQCQVYQKTKVCQGIQDSSDKKEWD